MSFLSSVKRIAAGVGNTASLGLSEVAGYKGRGNPLSFLSPTATTQTQVPLETPEQAAARKRLLQIGMGGGFDGLNFGEGYQGPVGNFDLTDTEKAGMGRLASFVNGQTPEIFDTGSQALKDLLTGDRFDPTNPNGEYAAFKTQTERELRDATTATKRSLAYSGDLYSSDAGRQIADLNARGSEALTSKLAELSDKYVQRRLSAIPLAAEFAQQKQAMDLAPITAAYTYGGKSRELADAEAKSKLAEWIRARQDKLKGLDILSTVAGQNSNFGVPSATAYTASPWMDLLQNIVGQRARGYFSAIGAA